MESNNDAFILNLKVNLLASSNEVHDAILEEIIRLTRGEKESESQTVGVKKSPSYSKRIPLANDLIQDVAVGPPYVGVLMKNGKVCRVKLLRENDEARDSILQDIIRLNRGEKESKSQTVGVKKSPSCLGEKKDEIELKSACLANSASKPHVKESGLPESHVRQTRNDKADETSAKPKEDADTDWKHDDNEASDQRRENLLIDLDFPVLAESPKRARLDESADENISSSFIVGLPTVGIIQEQSFEERRFAELIGLGMTQSDVVDVRRILEREQQISSLGESNPFAATNFSASVNDYESFQSDFQSDMSTEGSLLGGSAILADPQNDVNSPGESMEDELLPDASSVLPIVLPSVARDPPAMLSNTKVMLSGRNSRPTGTESGVSASRKRSYPFPDGFRSLSDRLSFINRAQKVEMPSSSSAKTLQPNHECPCNYRDLKISQLEWLQCDYKDIQFSSISATYSEFILVTKADGKLWSWPIPKAEITQQNLKAIPHPEANNLNLDDEKIRFINSDIIHTSMVTASGKIASFFDPIFSGLNQRHLPSLIQRLGQRATYHKELDGENIIDVRCGHLFSVALTESGKVFWWGLSPEQAKTAKKTKKHKRRSIHESFLQVGDTVALKERKEEIGAIVMRSCFINGPKIGKIVKIMETDKSNEASERKNYTIETLTSAVDHQAASSSVYREVIWSSDEVIFLEERACTVGTVVGLDGHYAVVSPTVHTSQPQPDDKQLKVCFRSSLVRVSNSTTKQTKSSNEFSINEDRYENAIRDSPCCIVDPNGTEELYKGYKAVAVSASKHGISMLLNRLSDQKAFLVHPESLKEDNSKVFTCSKRSAGHEKEFLKSDSNVTSEFEAVSATQCQLDICISEVPTQKLGSSTQSPRHGSDKDGCTVVKDDRSLSQNEPMEQDGVLGQQQEIKPDLQNEFRARVTAPNLINLDNPDTAILLDRNHCLFPIKYNSCLLQSGTLDVPPMRILKIVETKFGDEENGEITITVVAAPKKLTLVPTILRNERSKFDEMLQAIKSEASKSVVSDSEVPSTGEKSSHSKDIIHVGEALGWLFEKYSGNQNVLHVCAGHIDMPSEKKHDKPSEDNYMLKSLLACEEIRNQLISLLKEQDSLGCTPFMTAVWTKNSRAALCILRSVLALSTADETLFNEAICRKSVSGMTPLHHLVFNLSPLAPNSILKNSLIVSSIPASYSPQMLLQLFKERYASTYRACIPVPTDKSQIKTAKEKLIQAKDDSRDCSSDQPVPQKMSHPFVPRYERLLRGDTPPQQSARARYAILNRTDALRASLKKGMVMFSDINEMNQALAEMDQYPLICKDDRSPPGLMSVARYHIQVRRADDPNNNRLPTMVRDDPLLGPRPTRHTIHPSLQGSMRFPRGHLFTDAALSRDIAHVRNILPQHIFPGSRVILPRESEADQSNTVSQTSKRKPGDPLTNGSSKQELDTESEDVLDVITELLDARPEVSSLVNDQHETAIAYYLKNAVRLTPDDLHKLFAKWRPCHASRKCLLNRLKYRGILQNVTVKSSSDKYETSSTDTTEVKPVVCPKPMDVESPQCSSKQSTAKESIHVEGTQIATEDPPKLHQNTNAPTERLAKKPTKFVPSYQLLAASNSPSRKSEKRRQDRSTVLSRSTLDEDLPRGLPEVKLRPTVANKGSLYENNSIDELVALASLCAGKSDDNVIPFDSRSLAYSQETSLLGTDTGSGDRETKTHVCTCRDNLMKIKEVPAMNFISMLSMLCIKDGVVGTIFGKSVSKLTDTDPYLSAEELDIVVANLMSNSIPSVVRTFVNTLLQMFRVSKSPDCLLTNYCFVSSDLRPISLDLDLVILETYKRFLSSVVRQLSLCLSKDNSVDLGLRHHIGRNAKSKEQSASERVSKSIRLCLRSFSWLAVIEILKAAETAIKPVRLGIAKAQPRGIMSGLRGMGERNTHPTMQNTHMLFGTRVTTSVRRVTESYRSSSHIKVASRRPQQPTTQALHPTRLIRRDSADDNPLATGRESLPGTSRDSNTNHVSAGLDNNLGIISPLAWTLDGHIRVSDAPRGPSLPRDFLDNRPDPDSIASIHAGNCYLAQMFCRLVKEAVDLASDLLSEDSHKYCPDEEIPSFEISTSTEEKLKEQAKIMLSKTWKWLFQIMDSLEIQLNVGDNFDTQRFTRRSLKPDTTFSDAALGRVPNVSQSYVSRPDEYLMYLLRAGNGDAEETFPILDLMSYSHVTFVLDAYFYLLKKWPIGVLADLHQNTHEQLQQDNQTASENIHPNVNSAPRDELNGFFGFADKVFEADIFKERQQEVLRKARSPQFWLIPLDAENGTAQVKNDGPREESKSKWKLTISAFAKLFLAETPGLERECFLAEYAGSAGRVSRFQRILASLKEECLPKSITEESRPFTVSIRRDKFLFDGLRALNPALDSHPYSSVNVHFEGEEGTGPGVNRGFFTGFANALTSEKCFSQSTSLLYQPGQLPGQARVFAPCEKGGDSNMNNCKLAYEGIGRFLGLSLWFNQAIPLIFTKPVLKFLLEKEHEITFNDLAFHNSTLYSTFGQMLIDSYSPDLSDEEFEDIYCCNFEFTTSGTTKELIPGGSKIKVTKKNAPELVRLSAMHIMIEVVRPRLEAMRNGLQQIVPKELLDPLNAEDFQSLLSGGVADVNFSRMKSLIRFNNSRSCSKESLERIKGWFWSIVHEMSPTQRMKLLYFLTGSAVLPAFDNKVGNGEELAVTIDVVGQSSTSLPVASTCGQRLSLPLYESKKELKRKLFMAIECDTYGLG